MHVDRRRQRFYGAGWLTSSLVAVAAAAQWAGRIKEVERRAAEVERTREADARNRAAQERLRIARDLHDSLTHSISVIKMQSGVAVHLARKRGEQVPDALLAIESAAADASQQLRETLQVLRRDDVPSGAGLSDLPQLISRFASGGLSVTLDTSGVRGEVPDEVDTAGYRIVQEALTNVTRHAGDASAAVTVDYQPTGVTLSVVDDGRGSGSVSDRPGLGLIGMRERATALGGTVTAGRRPGGRGFSVRAVLPLDGS